MKKPEPSPSPKTEYNSLEEALTGIAEILRCDIKELREKIEKALSKKTLTRRIETEGKRCEVVWSRNDLSVILKVLRAHEADAKRFFSGNLVEITWKEVKKSGPIDNIPLDAPNRHELERAAIEKAMKEAPIVRELIVRRMSGARYRI